MAKAVVMKLDGKLASQWSEIMSSSRLRQLENRLGVSEAVKAVEINAKLEDFRAAHPARKATPVRDKLNVVWACMCLPFMGAKAKPRKSADIRG